MRTRPGRHTPAFKRLDLGGKNALVSHEFSYFGASPVDLPRELSAVVKKGNGHRSFANDGHQGMFAEWAAGLPRGVVGEPQMFPWGKD